MCGIRTGIFVRAVIPGHSHRRVGIDAFLLGLSLDVSGERLGWRSEYALMLRE